MCLLAIGETQVQSLGWEDPLEKEMAAHSNTLAWKVPWMEQPGRLHVMECQGDCPQSSNFISHESGCWPLLDVRSYDGTFHLFRVKTGLTVHREAWCAAVHEVSKSWTWLRLNWSNKFKKIEENNWMGKTRDLFKRIRDTKGTFYAKMDTIKDTNGMDLIEAEDIKKR